MAIIAYLQEAMDMEDLFWTLVNCTVGIYNIVEKGDTNRTWAFECDLYVWRKVLLYFSLLIR